MVNVAQIVWLLASRLFVLPQVSKPDPFLDTRGSKTVVIIGGGSAGLGALKALLDLPHDIRASWNISLFDEREDVGGVW